MGASVPCTQAELADRDFTAERSNVVVISSGTASALDEEVRQPLST